MNRSVLQRTQELKALLLLSGALKGELPIICFWQKLHSPGQYPTISASAIVVAYFSTFQVQVRRILQEII